MNYLIFKSCSFSCNFLLSLKSAGKVLKVFQKRILLSYWRALDSSLYGEQTLFSALDSPGKTRAEKSVCSPQASWTAVLSQYSDDWLDLYLPHIGEGTNKDCNQKRTMNNISGPFLGTIENWQFTKQTQFILYTRTIVCDSRCCYCFTYVW